MKHIIVIGDGMADNPLEALGGKTPLQAAEKPVMDRLAAGGTVGRVRTVPVGVPAGSDTAILSIFGYDPRHYHSGRSPLEAAGSGVALRDGDISYRCNMVALSDDTAVYGQKKLLSHNGGQVDGEAALALMDALMADRRFAGLLAQHRMTLHPSPSFRHIAVQQGADITGLCAIPPHDHLGETVAANLPGGAPAAEGLNALMQLAHAILNDHAVNRQRRQRGQLPANGLWFWAEGVAIALPQFEALHGKKGVIVSAVPLAQGIGTLAGLDIARVDDATGELDTNYEGKALAALDALANGADFALVHVEAPDECTHNGDLEGKLEAIRRLDGRCLAPLVAGLETTDEPYRLLVLSDHKTLMENGKHDGDPVPFLLYDSTKPASGGPVYSEATGEAGPFIEEGHTLIDMLFGSL